VSESEDDDHGITEIKTAIDDMTPEQLGFLMELLLENAALDVYYTPIYMKKNRPGQELTVLCREGHKEQIIHIIFKHSTAIGMKVNPVGRRVMSRETRKINTEYGELQVKRSQYGNIIKEKPEYESARAAAKLHDVTLDEINRAALGKK
jgi:uncharacterized protein (DUF111 family)